MEVTNLQAVLVWMTGIGATVAVNWLFGKIAENIKSWNDLPKTVKWIVPPIVAVLLGLGADFLLKQDQIVAAIQPYWSLLATILMGYFGSQVAHLQAKKAKS